jgi:hypothetical protein
VAARVSAVIGDGPAGAGLGAVRARVTATAAGGEAQRRKSPQSKPPSD